LGRLVQEANDAIPGPSCDQPDDLYRTLLSLQVSGRSGENHADSWPALPGIHQTIPVSDIASLQNLQMQRWPKELSSA